MKGQVFIYFLPFLSLFSSQKDTNSTMRKPGRWGNLIALFPTLPPQGLGSLARRKLMFAFVFIAEKAKRISRHTIGNLDQKECASAVFLYSISQL